MSLCQIYLNRINDCTFVGLEDYNISMEGIFDTIWEKIKKFFTWLKQKLRDFKNWCMLKLSKMKEAIKLVFSREARLKKIRDDYQKSLDKASKQARAKLDSLEKEVCDAWFDKHGSFYAPSTNIVNTYSSNYFNFVASSIKILHNNCKSVFSHINVDKISNLLGNANYKDLLNELLSRDGVLAGIDKESLKKYNFKIEEKPISPNSDITFIFESISSGDVNIERTEINKNNYSFDMISSITGILSKYLSEISAKIQAATLNAINCVSLADAIEKSEAHLYKSLKEDRDTAIQSGYAGYATIRLEMLKASFSSITSLQKNITDYYSKYRYLHESFLNNCLDLQHYITNTMFSNMFAKNNL